MDPCEAARRLNLQMRSVWREPTPGLECFFYCECGCFERRREPTLVAMPPAVYDELDGAPLLAPGHIRIAF